jgi:hypothetical protein
VSKYTETVEVTVEIEVNDRDAIDRVTGPAGSEWRAHAYALYTERDVLEHWAYNAVANGVQLACQLNGWADMNDDAVRMHVKDVNFDR